MSLDIIKNYARSFFDIAKLESKEDLVLEQIKLISDLMLASDLIHNVLCSEVITKTDKLKLLKIIYDKCKFDDLSTKCLYILIKNSRCVLLSDIVNAMSKLIEISKGIKSVKIVSAFKLSKNDLSEIQSFVENKFKQTVTTTIAVDSALIGGVVIKYGNTQIDCSVRSALDTIKKRL